jgi:hypothetical protein
MLCSIPPPLSVDQNFGFACFSILVVAADPSFLNNNQQVLYQVPFWLPTTLWVAGWLYSKIKQITQHTQNVATVS